MTGYRRHCHDCGSTNRDTAFPGTRKPHGRTDRCADCTADPFAAARDRAAERRAELALLRAQGWYRPPKPVHTLPLFAALRPARGATTHETPAHDAAGGN